MEIFYEKEIKDRPLRGLISNLKYPSKVKAETSKVVQNSKVKCTSQQRFNFFSTEYSVSQICRCRSVMNAKKRFGKIFALPHTFIRHTVQFLFLDNKPLGVVFCLSLFFVLATLPVFFFFRILFHRNES